MEGSPLGNAFGDSAGRKKSRKSFLLIAVAAALGLGGTVLAANITINGGNNEIEFGQGVATTAPCDTDMTISPFSAYNEQDGVFYLDTIEVSDIGDDCTQRNLTVSVFASGTAVAVYSSQKALASVAPIPVQTFEVDERTVNTNKVDSITVETNN